jgi:AraC-like DNA-binding protein
MHDLVLAERPLAPHQRVRRWHNRGDVYVGGATAHTGTEVAWFEESTARYEVGSRGFDVPPAVPVIIPAGMEHVTHIPAHARARSLLLDTATLDEVGDTIRPGVQTSRTEAKLLGSRPRLLSLARLIDEEAFSPDEPGRQLAVDALLEALAVEILRAGAMEDGGGQSRDPRIRRAVDCVHSRYTEALSVDELAHAAGMSRFHFSRLFRDQVGVSPYRYLIATRVAGAAERLRSGRCSVTEAALDVGFRDLGRFSRSFRAEMGLSPGEYARVARERRQFVG